MPNNLVSLDGRTQSVPTYQIDDANLLLNGEFTRQGFDLVITGPDGQQIIVADYFSFNPPPNLMLPNGTGLSPQLVKAFLHDTFGDTLFAGPAAGEAKVEIGTVGFISGKVTRKGVDGQEEVLKKGDTLYKGDDLEVDGSGFILAKMLDGTRFRLGSDARATLTDFQFDEAAKIGHFEVSVLRGGFSYKSGMIGKLGNPGNHSQISTPSAVIGIRGSELDGTVDSSGQTIIIHKSGSLTVSDINGNNPVVLDIPGNTSVIVLNGNPSFIPQASPQQESMVEQSQPPRSADEQQDEKTSDAAINEPSDETTEAEEKTAETAEGSSEEEKTDDQSEQAQEDDEAQEGDNKDGDDVEEGEEAEDSAEDDANETADATDEAELNTEDSASPESSDGSTSSTTGPQPDSNTESQASSRTDANTQSQDITDATSTTQPEPTSPLDTTVVLAPDNAPKALNDLIELNTSGSINITALLLVNDNDPDKGQFPFISSVNQTGLTGTLILDKISHNLTFIPDSAAFDALAQGETLTQSFNYTVQSGDLSDVATVQLTLTGINDAPMAVDDNFTIGENEVLTLSAANGLLINDGDVDAGDTFTVTGAEVISPDQTPIIIQADGSVTFVTTSSAVLDALGEGKSFTSQFTYTITDSNGASSTATASITVVGANDAPILTQDAVNINKGDTTLLSPLENDRDPEGDVMTIISVSSDNTSVLLLNDGTIEYTAPTDGNIQESISYTVRDAFGNTSTSTILINVIETNQAPVAIDDIAVVKESSTTSLDLLANDSDADFDALTITAISAPTLGSAAISADGKTINYTAPNDLLPGVVQTTVITYTVSDGGRSSTASVNITINALSNPPVASSNASSPQLILANTGDILLDVLAQVSDDSTGLEVIALDTTNTIGEVRLGSVIYNSLGAFDGLNEGQSATDSFGYTVQDTDGQTVNGVYTLSIAGIADAPVVSGSILINLTEGDPGLEINLLQGATDKDTNDVLSIINIVMTPVTFGSQGSAISPLTFAEFLAMTGSTFDGINLTLNPVGFDALQQGELLAVNLSYDIQDTTGLLVAQTAQINISGVNSAPLTSNDFATTVSNTSILPNPGTSLLINDIDPENDPLNVVSVNGGGFQSVGSNIILASGSIFNIAADGTYSYIPNIAPAFGSTETESVVYTVSDPSGATSTATLTVTVAGINNAPIATDQFFTVPESNVFLTSESLLNAVTDPDVFDTISFVSLINEGTVITPGGIFTLSSGATIEVDAAGFILSYDPTNAIAFQALNQGEFAEEIFILTATDQNGATSTSFVTIQIEGESLPEVLITSHATDQSLLDINIGGDQATDLQGVYITLEGTRGNSGSVISVSDTGAGTISFPSTTPFISMVDGNALQVGRELFAFQNNRFLIDSRLPSVTIEGMLNEVNDFADAYSVTLNPGESLIMDIDGALGAGLASGDLQLSIFDGAGTLVFFQIDGNLLDTGTVDGWDPLAIFTAPTVNGGPAQYTIVVSGDGSLFSSTTLNQVAVTADYTLNLSLITQTPEEFFQNSVTIIDETEIEPSEFIPDLPDEISSAREIDRESFGLSDSRLHGALPTVTLLGDLSNDDKADVFKVFLEAGDQITLDFDLTTAFQFGNDSLNLSVNIFDSQLNDQLVTPSSLPDPGTNGAADSLYTFTAVTSQFYTFSIQSNGESVLDQTGDYALHISLDVSGNSTSTFSPLQEHNVFSEQQLSPPLFRPETDFIDIQIPELFGVRSYINDLGEITLFGAALPSEYEQILNNITIDSPLSDPNATVGLTIFGTDSTNNQCLIDSVDVRFQSTEVQLSNIRNSFGDAGTSLNGPSNNNFVEDGLFVSGDFNGDGFDDLILSDGGYSYYGSSSSIIYFGGDDQHADLSLYKTLQINSYEAITSVQHAGDINGDGFDDLFVQFNYSYYGPSQLTAIVFGKDTSAIPNNTGIDDTILLDGSTNLQLVQLITVESAKLIALGDIDGDGFDDFMTFDKNQSTQQLIFGADAATLANGLNQYSRLDPGALLTDNISFNTSGIQFPSNSILASTHPFDYSINNIVAVGDINGDGHNDILLQFDQGAYIVFGNTREALMQRENLGTPGVLDSETYFNEGVWLLPDASPQNDGQTLSLSRAQSLGDINGDGIDDLMVEITRSPIDTRYLNDQVGTYVIFGGEFTNLAQDLFTPGGIYLSDIAGSDGSLGFKVTSSELTNAATGISDLFAKVENIGDVNGDGFDDLLIAPFTQSYFTAGMTAQLPQQPITPIELSAVENGLHGFAIHGISSYDLAGDSVSNAGDVNGDGIDDVIIGAMFSDANGFNSGSAYVVYGNSNGTNVELSDVENGSGGFAIHGASAGDQAGNSVSSAGDVNGDGIDDVIIGATYADPNGTFSGAAYVVFGALDNSGGGDVELSSVQSGTGGFAIHGAANDDRAGFSVSSIGDINGDGQADLLVGAILNDASSFNSGTTYVVYGKSDGTLVELSNIGNGAGGFAIHGATTYDLSGFSVSGAGDVNGDGLEDLIIGTQSSGPYGDSSGMAFVVYGRTDSTDIELSSVKNGTGGFTINGASVGDRAGFSVSDAGDVNGDGLADLIVGAPFDNPNGSQSGAGFVIFGKNNGTAVELSNIENGTGGFAIHGISAYDRSGYSVSSAGDLNGDGFDDVIIGAHRYSVNGTSSGAAYVVYGKNNGTSVELSTLQYGVKGFAIYGGSVNDQAGKSVSAAGDINGDGLADLIVGAPYNDANGGASGSAYIIYGTPVSHTVEVLTTSNIQLVGDPVVIFGGPTIAGGIPQFDISQQDESSGYEINGSFQRNNYDGDERYSEGYGYGGQSNILGGTGDFNGDGLDDFFLIDSLIDFTGISGGGSHLSDITSTGVVLVYGNSTTDPQLAIGTSLDDTITLPATIKTVHAGAGNDLINLSLFDPASLVLIDGGSGNDTLTLPDLTLIDLDSSPLSRIEALNLTGVNNQINVSAESIIRLSDDNSLTIFGAAGNLINTSDTAWLANGTTSVNAILFNRFVNGEATLLIQDGIALADINVSLGGLENQTISGLVATPIFGQVITLPNGTTITKINGVSFTAGSSIKLDSGGSITVNDINAGTATFDYDPSFAFLDRQVGELGFEAIEIEYSDGKVTDLTTIRLAVPGTNDPLTVFTGAIQTYNNGDLLVPLFDNNVSLNDPDNPVYTSVRITLTSGQAFGSLVVDESLIDPGIRFQYHDISQYHSEVVLTLFDGAQFFPRALVEQFLKAVQYVPGGQDQLTSTANFTVTLISDSGPDTFAHSINITSGLITEPLTAGLWNLAGNWSEGQAPTSSNDVIIVGNSADSLTVDSPSTAGAIYIDNSNFSLQILDSLTVSNDFVLVNQQSVSIQAGVNHASLIADNIILDGTLSGARLDILGPISGISVPTIKALNLLSINGELHIGNSTDLPQVEATIADLNHARINLAGNTDVRFSNPLGLLQAQIGEQTLLHSANQQSVIFSNTDLQLSSDFELITTDENGNNYANIILAESGILSGNHTFTNHRNDFYLADDTLAAGTRLNNQGTLTILGNTLLNGDLSNAGTLVFEGSSAQLNGNFINQAGSILELHDGEAGATSPLTNPSIIVTPVSNSISIDANQHLVNQGVIEVVNGSQTIIGNITSSGDIVVTSGATLNIQNNNSLLNLASGDLEVMAGGTVNINGGHLVINNDTVFSIDGILNINGTDVRNGASTLLVDYDAVLDEGLLLSGNFSLGLDTVDNLITFGTLGTRLGAGPMSFSGDVEISEDSVYIADLSGGAGLSDILQFDTVSLDGVLHLNFYDSTPSVANIYTILSSNLMSGSFGLLENEIIFQDGPTNIANIVYGLNAVSIEILAVTMDSVTNGSNPTFVLSTGIDVVRSGNQAGNTYLGIGAGDIVIDRGGLPGGATEVFEVSALNFSRLAGEETSTNQLRITAAGEFNFVDLPGTSLDNFSQIDLTSLGQQTITLDDQSIINISDDSNNTLRIFATDPVLNPGAGVDEVVLFGDFSPIDGGLGFTTYHSNTATIDVSNNAIVRVSRLDGSQRIYGSAIADTLIGTEGNDFIDGRLGNDSILALGGDDVLLYDSNDLSLVDAGLGIDSLLFSGEEFLDLSNAGNLTNFEKITFGTNSTLSGLSLDFTDLFGIGNFLDDQQLDTFSAGIAFGDHQLLIDGDTAGSIIILNGLEIVNDGSNFANLTSAGISVKSGGIIEGAETMAFTQGDVTIFITRDILDSLTLIAPPMA